MKEKTEWALMEAVTHGPVSVSIEGGLPSFQFYKSGVFHDDACGAELNHGKVPAPWLFIKPCDGWLACCVSELVFDLIFPLRCTFGWLCLSSQSG